MPRLLIVEDDPGFLNLICARLDEAGYEDCDCARSVEEALGHLEGAQTYDVVVADMWLGGYARGGFEVAYAVRDRNREAMPYGEAEVIIFTANDTVEDAIEALRPRFATDPYGEGSICRHYISKTMVEGSALDELVRVIGECLQH